MTNDLLFSSFNPMKILHYSKDIEKLIYKNEIPIPTTISFDLSNRCQHNCIWCSWREHREKDGNFIDKNIIKNVISECKILGITGFEICGGGEPLIHPDAEEIIKNIGSAGNLYLITNGSKLNEEIIKYCKIIRISLDAGTSETHKKLHQIDDFDNIINNIKKSVKYVKTGIGFLIHPENYTEIPLASKIAKSLGCKYIQIRPCYNNEWFRWIEKKVQEVQIQINKAKAEETNDFKVFTTLYKTKPKKDWEFDKCRASYFNPLITPSGSMWICCERRGIEDSKFGTIGIDGTFTEILFSDKHKKLIDKCPNDLCPSKDKYLGYNNIIWNAYIKKNIDLDWI